VVAYFNQFGKVFVAISQHFDIFESEFDFVSFGEFLTLDSFHVDFIGLELGYHFSDHTGGCEVPLGDDGCSHILGVLVEDAAVSFVSDYLPEPVGHPEQLVVQILLHVRVRLPHIHSHFIKTVLSVDLEEHFLLAVLAAVEL